MSSCQDYHTVLGAAPTADPEVIRAAYRVLAQRHHPDRNAAGDGATMVLLNQAYAVLSCAQQRADYDRTQQRATLRSQAPLPRSPVVLTTYDHRGRLHAYA
jgi:curved DNA-binding protein CbpA